METNSSLPDKNAPQDCRSFELDTTESPWVTLNQTLFFGCVMLTAKVQNFKEIKVIDVSWNKDNKRIDIRQQKYEGSTKDSSCPVLYVNNVKKEDEGVYSVEVKTQYGKGICSQNLIAPEGRPYVTLCAVPEALYGESVKLVAKIWSLHESPTVKWKKGNDYINTSQQKYSGSSDYDMCSVLKINNIIKEDENLYSVEVQNKFGRQSCSHNVVVTGEPPNVTLEEVPEALYDESVQFRATVRSFATKTCVIWKKGNEIIDIQQPKYVGSSDIGDYPVLIINYVTKEDEDVYSIEVENDFGKRKRSQKLVLESELIIFISGPVVVSPAATIHYQADISNQNFLNGKWWKIKKGSTIEIEFNSSKYFSYQKDDIQIHEMEIIQAEEDDSAKYQFLADNIQSNMITTFVDDSGDFSTEKEANLLRFFALQTVSANALRNYMNNQDGTFEEKIKIYCQSVSHESKDLRSRLQEKKITSYKDLDLSLMYRMLRNPNGQKSKKGGQIDFPNMTKTDAEAIEQIIQHRNTISHSNAMEMETPTFNKDVLSLIRVINVVLYEISWNYILTEMSICNLGDQKQGLKNTSLTIIMLENLCFIYHK